MWFYVPSSRHGLSTFLPSFSQTWCTHVLVQLFEAEVARPVNVWVKSLQGAVRFRRVMSATQTKQNLMLLAHWSRTCAQARRDLAGWLADWLADTCRTGKLAADGQGAQPVHVGQMPGTRDIDLFCLFVCLAAPHGHGSASSKWQ